MSVGARSESEYEDEHVCAFRDMDLYMESGWVCRCEWDGFRSLHDAYVRYLVMTSACAMFF